MYPFSLYSPAKGVQKEMVRAPIRVITVEREYGSHGGEFAHDLAARLGWRLLDSELAASAALKAGVDPKTAAKYDEQIDPWYRRYGKIFWLDPVYTPAPSSEEDVFDSERMLKLIKQEILDAANAGQLRAGGAGIGLRPGRSAGMLSYFCVRYGTSQERLVCAHVSAAGAAR